MSVRAKSRTLQTYNMSLDFARDDSWIKKIIIYSTELEVDYLPLF